MGEPERYPMFYTHESYQEHRRIYPYALQDHLTHERAEKTYTMLTLENEYVRLSLPKLRTSVGHWTRPITIIFKQLIKPALIGMLGAWFRRH